MIFKNTIALLYPKNNSKDYGNFIGLGYALGQNSVQFLKKHKKPVAAVTVGTLETINCVITGEIPELTTAPYSLDSLTNSMNTTLSLKDKDSPIISKLSEPTFKPVNSDILTEDNNYIADLEKRISELTNIDQGNSKTIQLLDDYLKNKLSTNNEMGSGVIPESIMYQYLYNMDHTTLKDLISQEIITISSRDELFQSICTLNSITYGLINNELRVDQESVIKYLKNLMILIENSPQELWSYQNELVLENWKESSKFIKNYVLSLAEKNKVLNDINFKEDLRQARLTEILIEHKNHLDSYPSSSSSEDMNNAIKQELQKLKENELRVKQCNILLEEIFKKRQETNSLVSEKLNSVIGRCEVC